MTHYQESRSLKRFIRTTLAKFTLSKVPANNLKNASQVWFIWEGNWRSLKEDADDLCSIISGCWLRFPKQGWEVDVRIRGFWCPGIRIEERSQSQENKTSISIFPAIPSPCGFVVLSLGSVFFWLFLSSHLSSWLLWLRCHPYMKCIWVPGMGAKGLVGLRTGWLYMTGWGGIMGTPPIWWPIWGGSIPYTGTWGVVIGKATGAGA